MMREGMEDIYMDYLFVVERYLGFGEREGGAP